MSRVIDITGKRFGLLIALERDLGRSDTERSYWLFACDCGRRKVIRSDGVLSGAVQSCGHLGIRRRTEGFKKTPRFHGRTRTSEYYVWVNMRNRCDNPKTRGWSYYGGRGIRVCERWEDFRIFIADMGPRPLPDMQIDRINNDGDYEPENCRWVTRSENLKNRRPMKRDWHGRILPRAQP